MTRSPTPQDFLLHLRGHFPALARRFDGISALSLTGAALVARAPAGSWSAAELLTHIDPLRAAVRRFFGPDTSLSLEYGDEDAERLPFPVLASKVWNHVAFWLPGTPSSAVLALRKPVYLEQGIPPRGSPDVFRQEYAAGEGAPALFLPDLLDDLCALGRAQSSYVQVVAPFPGDELADQLEGRLYAVKEWGTPKTPSAILQKYVGRLHYVSPVRPPLGIRMLCARRPAE